MAVQPGSVEVTDKRGKRMARLDISAQERAPYFDSTASTYYYRILTDRIERVLPAEGRRWRFKTE